MFTLSPATILEHESDHALEAAKSPGTKYANSTTQSKKYDNKEEERVIKTPTGARLQRVHPDGMWPDNPIKSLINRVKHEVKSYVSKKVDNVVSNLKSYVGQKSRELLNSITPNNPFTKAKPEKAEKGSGYGVNFTVEGGKEGGMTTPQGDRDVQSEDMTNTMIFAIDVFGPETKLPGVAPDGSNPLNGETNGEAATESTMSTATSSEDQTVEITSKKFVATDPIRGNSSQVHAFTKKSTVNKSALDSVKSAHTKDSLKADKDSKKKNTEYNKKRNF